MISIVIPLYNKAHTIVNTLNTVFNQTYQNFEIIIVNDGSTDNGIEIINQNFTDNRIKIINQENQGVSVARDRGVKEATSNYIAFLDADDNWHPEYLTIMESAIRKFPNSALYSSAGLIKNANGTTNFRIAKKYLNKIIQVDFFENPFVFTHTSATIINKTYFNKTEGSPRGMLCLQDFALFIQLALIGKFTYVGLPISKYIGGITGQTTSADKEKRFKLLKFVCYLYNFTCQKEIESPNKTFHVFIKHDIRHRIKGFINQKDQRSLSYFLKNLSPIVINHFSKWEISLYEKKLYHLALLWINLSKIIWRLHKYPSVR